MPQKLKKICTKCTNLVVHWKKNLCEQHQREYDDWLEFRKSLTIKKLKDANPKITRQQLIKKIRGHARNTISFRTLKKKPCAKCGYDKHVEIAHIIPIHKFPEEILLTEINSANNLIQLCPNHHWEFDNNI